MTEGHNQEHLTEGGALPLETDQAPVESVQSARPAGGSRQTAWWLAALLLLVIAGVSLSPFWARDVAPLLPWGGKPEAPTEDFAALAARLDAFEKRPAPPSLDIGAINSALGALVRRVDHLESARPTDHQIEAAVAATKAGLQQLEERLSTFEAQSASRATGEAVQFEKLREELAQIGSTSTDLAERLPAVERRVGTTGAAVRTEAALLAALFRMREAVEAARPFATEYDAFITLAHDQADLIAAAQPLAAVARVGVAGNAVLSERLGQVSGLVVPATPPPVGSDLGTQALTWLHSLVTIRRIDAAAQTGLEPAMKVAQVALARGDLSGAVSALQTLAGPDSGATQSWLHMAQQRLAAEAALAHLQELLVVRLGILPEAPGGAPTQTPARSAQPS